MRRKFLVSFLLFIFVFFFIATISNAAYQSRPGFTALTNVTASDFFENIRKMETSEGPMGLNATLGEDFSDSSGNGIDVHMIKNTEWGAVAMLASSGYGAGTDSAAGTYSTGSNNYTGVYGLGNGNWEYTATLTSTASAASVRTNLEKAYKGNGKKYLDYYTLQNSSTNTSYSSFPHKVGDATVETMNLFTGTKNLVTAGNPCFIRGNSNNGGILSFNNNNGNANSNYASRAVAVCGSGLLCEVYFINIFRRA